MFSWLTCREDPYPGTLRATGLGQCGESSPAEVRNHICFPGSRTLDNYANRVRFERARLKGTGVRGEEVGVQQSGAFDLGTQRSILQPASPSGRSGYPKHLAYS